MRTLLKKYFGHDDFRSMQKEIIDNVLKKKDTFVLMLTGGGKSLCYQLPSLKFEGLTLVISPLISLMKDQVDALKEKGINAEYINSSLSREEMNDIRAKIKKKETKILYIAPERLALEEFKLFLLSLKINLIAIDEAHCISEWGHDFREEYRNLKFLKIIFPKVPIIALTATATEKVRKDILKQLSLENPTVFVSSFNRENLNLIVREKKNTFNKILNLINNQKDGSIIVYCFSRKDSEKIAQRLRENGFNALPYHAGLNNEIRRHNQELFIQNKVKIIVATIAFGMGIDKPDVRLIIHHTFSKTLESYYQEIGRAGRDGLSSDCVLFYSWGDKRKHEFFIKQMDEYSQNKSREQLRKMMDYCEYNFCRRKYILGYFGEKFLEDNCGGCDVCLELPKMEEEIIAQRTRSEKIKEDMDYDKSLFEELRVLRKQIANEKNFPAFVIFSDVSLKEMAFRFPKNNEEFLEIKGVGEQKLNDYGDLFLEVIRNYTEENNLAPKKITEMTYRKSVRHLSRNYQKTKEMILEKRTINEIARMQGLKESRIIYHIEILIEGGEKIDINHIAPSKKSVERINASFEKFGIERLAPIYNYFNGKFSYDEIRLVRAIIKSKGMIKDDIGINMKTNYHERLEEIKEEFSNAYEPWEEEEDNKLKKLFSNNVPIQALAKIFKRQPSAIRSRLRKFG